MGDNTSKRRLIKRDELTRGDDGRIVGGYLNIKQTIDLFSIRSMMGSSGMDRVEDIDGTLCLRSLLYRRRR